MKEKDLHEGARLNQGSSQVRRLNQRPHRRFGHSGHTRRGRLIEKDHELNMDAQDAQDNRDGTLVPEKPAPAMIRCGLADAQECKPADS